MSGIKIDVRSRPGEKKVQAGWENGRENEPDNLSSEVF